jgi:hypothetical protein
MPAIYHIHIDENRPTLGEMIVTGFGSEFIRAPPQRKKRDPKADKEMLELVLQDAQPTNDAGGEEAASSECSDLEDPELIGEPPGDDMLGGVPPELLEDVLENTLEEEIVVEEPPPPRTMAFFRFSQRTSLSPRFPPLPTLEELAAAMRVDINGCMSCDLYQRGRMVAKLAYFPVEAPAHKQRVTIRCHLHVGCRLVKQRGYWPDICFHRWIAMGTTVHTAAEHIALGPVIEKESVFPCP